MAAWNISAPGVQDVLTATYEVALGFDAQVRTLNTAIDGALAQCSSGQVAEALSELATAQTAQVNGVFTRTQACLTGASNATTAYLDGDLEMAATAQAAASAIPVPR